MRLKIAVQQVLDEAPYQQHLYHREQASNPNGYTDYYYGAAQGEDQEASAYEHQSEWPANDQTSSDATAVTTGYEGYCYTQEPVTQLAAEQYEVSANRGYYDYAAEASAYTEAHAQDHTAEQLYPPPSYYDQAAATTEAESSDQTSTESYFQYRAQHEAVIMDQIESQVVEAHAVVVEDAKSYDEILAPTLPQQQQHWSCRQCTFLNPVSESFCEMCHDHISASPDMAGVLFPSGAQAPSSPMKPDQAYPHGIMVSAQPTPPLSPLYSPSAPSYETMDCDEDHQHHTVVLPPAPFGIAHAIPAEVAKQLAFQGASTGNEDCEVIHSTKVLVQMPENYLALAFKGKAGASPMAQAQGGSVVSKSDQVRREEDALTEYSF